MPSRIENIWNSIGRDYWKGRKRGPMSEEHKRKVSESKKGKLPWNTGRHRSKEDCLKVSEGMKRRYAMGFQSPFHKGHTIRNTGRTRFKLGQLSTWRGRHFTEESKRKIRLARLKQVFPQKDTKIEVLMQTEFTRRGIKFSKHLPVCDICQTDIAFSEQKIAVFCDGDYWHNLPRYVERDKRITGILEANGWKVYRFWEHEILASPNQCVDRLKEVVLGVPSLPQGN
jgi:DNA mismatch endonuclease (patch repair protein)